MEAAARLQDVGYLIDYDQHHKHSYHLILNSHLAGISPHELELIANVARYHRGAKPKARHANFSQLCGKDQRRVRHLAAILRIAGGLDRSHTQTVRDVHLDRSNSHLMLNVTSDESPEVDIWGARKRCGFFESVYDMPLAIEWFEPQAAAPVNGDTALATRPA